MIDALRAPLSRSLRPSFRALVALWTTLVLLLSPALALAAGKDHGSHAHPNPAADLKTQGDHAMDGLHYDDALALYERAYEISRDPALLYNQARALQALGDYPSALDYLERFEAAASAALKARVPDLAGLGADLRSKVSSLTLTCDAPGAEVVLRDKVIGTTPLSPVRATAGKATLVIRSDKYQEYRTEVDLVGGQNVAITATLTPKDTSSVLFVTSPVAGAHVTLDGTARGDVPLELVTTAGLHTIRLDQSGYEATETSAVLAPATRRELDVPLRKGTLIVARWWFWTAVGVAVAGGVATYIVLTTERSPDHGSINPGVVSTPSGASLRF